MTPVTFGIQYTSFSVEENQTNNINNNKSTACNLIDQRIANLIINHLLIDEDEEKLNTCRKALLKIENQ